MSQLASVNCHNGFTQCYLPLEQVNAPRRRPNPSQVDTLVLDLPITKGWKVELSLVVGYTEMVYQSVDSRPSM